MAKFKLSHIDGDDNYHYDADSFDATDITLTEGSIMVGDSNGLASELDASTDTQILVGNGTTITSVALSGDATMTNAGVVTVVSANAAFDIGTNLTWALEVNHTDTVTTSTTSDTAGGSMTRAAGAANGAANGGAYSIVGGASGAGATGNGGAVSATGGAALSTNGTGGAASLVGGVATGNGTGGGVTITSGASAGASGTAGDVAIDAGSAAGGTAGSITIGTSNAGAVTIGATSVPVNMTNGGLRTIQAVDNVNDTTPSDAELDTAFGTPATLGRGFIGTIDDADGDTNFYLCLTSDASWYFLKFTKAT